MNLRSGYPLSLIRNGIPFDYPKLDADIQADIVIVGGGISGALAGFYLQQEGFDTVVLDRRTVGLGSTCASTSLLLYEIDIPLHELREKRGQACADRAYSLSEESVYLLEKLARHIGFNNFYPTNSLYCAANKAELGLLESEYEARLSIGLDVDWYDRYKLEQQYGVAAPGAIVSRCAAKTDAYLLTHAIHQYNQKKGVRVFDRTCMAAFESGKKGVKLVTSEGYKVKARHLVFANGYEALEHLPKKLATLRSTYVVASEQLTASVLGQLQDMVLWTTGDPYLYMRTTADNRIMIGGRDEQYHSPAKLDRLISAKARQLGKDFEKLVPAIPFSGEFSWAGTFATKPDGLPYIGQYPGLANCYFALGFGGNGITFAALAAKLITQMISGRDDRDGILFSFDR